MRPVSKLRRRPPGRLGRTPTPIPPFRRARAARGAILRGMGRVAGIAAASLIVAATATAAQGAPAPHLEAVTAKSGILALTIDPEGLTPASIQVATHPDTTASGGFPAANVKLRERLTGSPDDATSVRRTHTKLPAGVY